LHVGASLLLSAFGMHRLYLARQYRRHVRGQFRRRAVGTPEQWPSVTVQVPLYNERYVAERAVRAVAALDYPRDRFEVQVLDDSTDDTTQLLEPVVADLRRQGVRIAHVRRNSRAGFKAGALAHGLESASGDLVAVFDADFVPRPDFLKQIVGEFERPEVGMVQARWEHINESQSLLTRTQALQLDAHFTIEHGVRAARGFFFNFNGTAGIWRKQAIVDAGGWHSDTLTEDLDLSYRAQLAGWHFVYRDDVGVPAELPVEVAAYRQQQQRWAQGGAQSARKLLPSIIRASLPPAVKREAIWHLLNHFAYPLLALVTTAGLWVGLFADLSLARWVLAADGALLTFAMLSLGYFYGVTARARGGAGWWRRTLLIPATMILGAGIALGQTLAVARGLAGRRTPFRRTPKYHIADDADESWRGASYRIPAGTPAMLEVLTGFALLAAAAAESMRGDILPSGLVLLFAMGFIFVGGISLLQLTGGPASDQNR
jgi:cellulose synthase/poly-beta-1,6-N-acetylglucosamine synthase-like glycosyltransferase